MSVRLLSLGCLAALTACTQPGPVAGPPDVPWTFDPHRDVDVNGDGLADIVGAGVEGYQSDCPVGTGCITKLRVWFGNPDFVFDTDAPDVDIDDVIGAIFASGDVNGDGHTDVFGSALHGRGLPNAMLLGTPSGFSEPIEHRGTRFSVGDVNCDGLTDIQSGFGVLYGHADIATTIASNDIEGSGYWEAFPGDLDSVAGTRPVGDMNADGCSDLLVDGRIVWGGANGMVPSDISPSEPLDAIPGPYDVDSNGAHDLLMENYVLLGMPGGDPTEVVREWWIPETDVGDVTGDGFSDALNAGVNSMTPPGTFPEDAVGLGYSIMAGGPAGYGNNMENPDGEVLLAAFTDDWLLESINAGDDLDRLDIDFDRTYWGEAQGSVGDLDGDGYRDYVIQASPFLFLFRGGDRLARRGSGSDGLVNIGTSGLPVRFGGVILDHERLFSQ